ncbi:dTDP-4-dehydrorhamnose 3,5-epimerase family protein [Halomonas pacifica]|uniref:dTDP-4-dehydrorhamnose 3,5-epimerase n=1 Tax=Bisbaumannia pacifica TaxID=77098 RepID=A0ABD4L1A5_9GAMM|nr:dTDP-4-dehydrorhamnose 3,5-epimerase family protein [Halomonas pacifica]MBH8579867.1 dTDP-4-dehydrorhamnose 3,5-epimerase family protein [Halomonas pacifica]MDC8803469.1 dTDP-4-dehydrorhamnose 3,5-epimerase family protein [Halomonas pacifica]
MTRLTLSETSIPDLSLLIRHPVGDDRGFMERLFCVDELSLVIGGGRISQINRSMTANSGTLRGMHFQYPPYSEKKIVTCLKGEIFDVAIDLRRGSPTFLSWHGEFLKASGHTSLVIPEGFAHGFQTMTDDCEVIYFCTNKYFPEAEGGIDALDPRVSIEWPLCISERSARDKTHPWLTNDFLGVE